jgi:hypothetical protein
MIALAIGAAVVVIYKLRHHSSLRRRDTTVQTNDTLNVAKGTVGAEARVARVEAADGNWFAVSKKDGTVFRDCAKEPLDITIGSKPENSPYRVRICGSGRHLILTGK